MFQLAYLNPPFDTRGKEAGGGRLELLFFKRVVEEGRWVQAGGWSCWSHPQDVLARTVCRNHLARAYHDLTILALPQAIRHYREVVMFGVVRAIPRVGEALRTRALEIAHLLAEALPELAVQAAPRYTLPTPQPLPALVWRDANAATPQQAQADVLAMGGAWAAQTYRERLRAARQERRQLCPLFPPSKVQAALGVAAGRINNQSVQIAGRDVRIKGTTMLNEQTWKEERSTGNGSVVETHHVTRRTPFVVTLDEATGAVAQYRGDAGMTRLMKHPDAAQSLIAAVERSAPPRYRMQLPLEVAAILASIKPCSGRALPGYAPGLLPMQQHLVAALVTAYTQRHPTTGEPPWRNLLLSAEMGAGKTTMAAATAEVLVHLAPTNPPTRVHRRPGRAQPSGR